MLISFIKLKGLVLKVVGLHLKSSSIIVLQLEHTGEQSSGVTAPPDSAAVKSKNYLQY